MLALTKVNSGCQVFIYCIKGLKVDLIAGEYREQDVGQYYGADKKRWPGNC